MGDRKVCDTELSSSLLLRLLPFTEMMVMLPLLDFLKEILYGKLCAAPPQNEV